MPDDWRPITLAECPPGPFLYRGHLGFKTEYGATLGKDIGGGRVEWTVSNFPEAYVFASGEFFWGEARTHEDRAKLLVVPIDPDVLLQAALASAPPPPES